MLGFVNTMCHKKLGMGKTIATTREVRRGDRERERKRERDVEMLRCSTFALAKQ